jgi:hypothetical protein
MILPQIRGVVQRDHIEPQIDRLNLIFWPYITRHSGDLHINPFMSSQEA